MYMVGSGRGQGSKLIPQLKCRGSLAHSSRLKGTGMNRDMKSFLLSYNAASFALYMQDRTINVSATTLKSSPATRHGGAWGERIYSSYSFTTSALDGAEWSNSRPGHALPPRGKDQQYALDRRLDGPQSRSGHRE
jgi:hypothetical protein